MDAASFDEDGYQELVGRHEEWLRLREWESFARAALLVLCDQVTRNLFRGTARAYAADRLALHHAERLLVGETWRRHPALRLLVCLPLVHSEDPAHFSRASGLVDEACADTRVDREVAAA